MESRKKTASFSQPRKYRVLILISDTGGGHRASADALSAAIHHEYPEMCEVLIVDIWSHHGVWPFNTFVPAYKYLCDNPQYWNLLYHSTKSQMSREIINVSGYALCGSRFRQAFETLQPDLICSMHPLCQYLPLRVLNELSERKRKIPFVTVVTDLGGAHPTWFDTRVDLCFVPSAAIEAVALTEGLTPSQLRLYGLPLRQEFWAAEMRRKEDIRQSLHIHPHYPTCLIAGGGQGVGDIQALTHEVVTAFLQDANKTQFQVVVICGTNAALQQDLKETYAEYLLSTSELDTSLVNTEMPRHGSGLLPQRRKTLDERGQCQHSCGKPKKPKDEDDTVPLRRATFPRSRSSPSLSTRSGFYCVSESLEFVDPRQRHRRGRATLLIRHGCAPYDRTILERHHQQRRQHHPSGGLIQRLWSSSFERGLLSQIKPPPTPHTGPSNRPNVSVVVLGFVTNMHDWMGAADILITKAGPGTIAEACTRKLPVLLHSYLPGQEEGNVDFVVNGRFGGYSASKTYIANMARYLLTSPIERQILSNRAGKAIDPQATCRIARTMITLMLEDHDSTTPADSVSPPLAA